MGAGIGRPISFAVLVSSAWACDAGQREATVQSIASRPDVEIAMALISGDSIARHVAHLASDRFDGRRPGTMGEVRTLSYLETALAEYGLEPLTSGGFRQGFPISALNVSFSGDVGTIDLVGGTNIAVAPWREPVVTFADAPIVYGGYGIVSPEHGRDDFDGVSLEGSVVLVFQGSPPDDPRFDAVGGYAHKASLLAERGAVAMVVVWREADSSFEETRWFYSSPFLRGGSDYQVIPILEPDLEVATGLLQSLGLGMEAARQVAALDGFHARRMSARLNGRLSTEKQAVSSNNLVAVLRGSDPSLASEGVILTAHWDHLGRDSMRVGDQVFNGALDNATGTGTLLELARVMAGISAPRRSIYFVWTGAEEFGLLGARAFIDAWPGPTGSIVANLNLDFQNPWGLASDVVVIGPGNTTLEDVFLEVVELQGRRISSEPSYEGFFEGGSDHWEFAKVGVPALFPASGLDLMEGGTDAARARNTDYVDSRYHRVADEPVPEHDYSGIAADARAFVLFTLTIAERIERPMWKTSTAYPELAALR